MDAPNFSLADKYSNLLAGSLAMWAAQGKIKKKYNITGCDISRSRISVYGETKVRGVVGGLSPRLLGSVGGCLFACSHASFVAEMNERA